MKWHQCRIVTQEKLFWTFLTWLKQRSFEVVKKEGRKTEKKNGSCDVFLLLSPESMTLSCADFERRQEHLFTYHVISEPVVREKHCRAPYLNPFSFVCKVSHDIVPTLCAETFLFPPFSFSFPPFSFSFLILFLWFCFLIFNFLYIFIFIYLFLFSFPFPFPFPYFTCKPEGGSLDKMLGDSSLKNSLRIPSVQFSMVA